MSYQRIPRSDSPRSKASMCTMICQYSRTLKLYIPRLHYLISFVEQKPKFRLIWGKPRLPLEVSGHLQL